MSNINNIHYNNIQEQLVSLLESIDRREFQKYYDAFDIELHDTKRTVPFYVGKLAGKTRKVLKKTETKTAVLISHWAVETFAFAFIAYTMVMFGSSVTAALFVAFYIYATYALFSLLVNQKR